MVYRWWITRLGSDRDDTAQCRTIVRTTQTPAPGVVHEQVPAPTLTPGPLDPRAITATIFTPTEYWDYATTSISKDDYFMGIVKVTSPDGLCKDTELLGSPAQYLLMLTTN